MHYRESSTKSEASFSSSRQEKSKIVVEKVEGVIEPNISSPNKAPSGTQTSFNPNDKSIPPPAELESVPASLSARLEK